MLAWSSIDLATRCPFSAPKVVKSAAGSRFPTGNAIKAEKLPLPCSLSRRLLFLVALSLCKRGQAHASVLLQVRYPLPERSLVCGTKMSE